MERTYYMALTIAALLALTLAAATATAQPAKVSIEFLKRLGAPVVYPIPATNTLYLEFYRDKLITVEQANGTYILTLRPLSDLTRNLYTYPLTGQPTLFKFNPSTGTIAVATAYGELLVGKVGETKVEVTRLHAGHGTPLDLELVGNTVIVLWSTTLGNELQVLVPSENGWHELAPTTGNMSKLYTPGYTVLEVEGLHEGAWPHPELNYMAIEYTVSPRLKVLLGFYYLNTTTGDLIPLNLSVVTLYVPLLGYRYETITNERGYAILSLPAIAPAGSVEELNTTFILRVGATTFVKTVTLKIPVKPDTLVQLNTSIVFTDEDRRRVPPPILLYSHIDFVEVKDHKLKIVKTLKLKTFNQLPDILAFYTLGTIHGTRYVLLVKGTFEATGTSLLAYILDRNFNTVKIGVLPLRSDVVAASVSKNGRILVLGFSDGTVEVLVYDDARGMYYEAWSYRASNHEPPVSMKLALTETFAGETELHMLAALTDRGELQVLAFNRTILAPVTRVDSVLSFTLGGPGLAVTASSDGNLLALSQPSTLYIVVDLANAALKTGLLDPVDLDRYIVTRLDVTVVEEDGTPVPNATVTVYRDGEPLVTLTTKSDGHVSIEPLLPGIYVLEVNPPKGAYWLRPAREHIMVPSTGAAVKVTLTYAPVNITVSLRDQLTGRPPAEPLAVLVDGKPVTLVKAGQSTVTLTLIKGVYNVTVRPIETDSLYQPVHLNITVPGPIKLDATLPRVLRTITLMFIDEDGNRLTEPVEIELSQNGITLYHDIVGPNELPLTVRVPTKGEATLIVSPVPRPGEAPKYQPLTTTIKIMNGLVKTVVIPLRYLTLTVVLRDMDTGEPPITPLVLYVDGRPRANLSAGTAMVTLSLTKGLHTLKIESQPTKEVPVPLYEEKTIRVTLRTPQSIIVELRRAYTLLNILLIDRIARTAPQDSIEVVYNDTVIGVSKPGQKNISVYVPRGEVTLELRSKNKLYYPLKLTVNATSIVANATASLRRTITTFKVTVVDFTGRRLTGVAITATGQDIPYSTTVLTVNGEAEVQVPYGIYLVCAHHPWFQERCTPIDPLATKETVIVLNYTPQGLIMANLGLIASIVAVVVIAVVLISLRHRIIRALAPEEEVF